MSFVGVAFFASKMKSLILGFLTPFPETILSKASFSRFIFSMSPSRFGVILLNDKAPSSEKSYSAEDMSNNNSGKITLNNFPIERPPTVNSTPRRLLTTFSLFSAILLWSIRSRYFFFPAGQVCISHSHPIVFNSPKEAEREYLNCEACSCV